MDSQLHPVVMGQIPILVVAAVGSVLVSVLRPTHAAIVYLVVLLLQSQDLGFSVGSFDLSSSRIVAIVLFLKCCQRLSGVLNQFHWNYLDTFVVLFVFGQTVSLCFTEEIMAALENRSGALVDQLIPYLIFRLVIKSRSDLLLILKALILISLPLAIAGVVESSTGHNYIGYFGPNMRDGHFRAYGTFKVHIAFGLFFSITLSLCVFLWKLRIWPKPYLLVFILFDIAGLLSSWSSAPIFALYFMTLFLLMYPVRKGLPVFLILGFIFIVMLDFLSRARWYDALANFGLSASTYAYRAGLYYEAFHGGMKGHWLFGWGTIAGVWATYEEFPWEYRDMVSLYISTLAKFGLLGFIPLLLVVGTSFYYFYILLARTKNQEWHWFTWSFFSLWVGLHAALTTVSILSQIYTLYFILLAFLSCMRGNVSSARSKSRSRSP